MNILLVYATYSNSTYEVATHLQQVLEGLGDTVTVQLASETKAEDFSDFDTVVFASPSWDYNGKEGQPHEDFAPLLESLSTADVSSLKYAICGTGDSSYTHFCGAVDVIEAALKTTPATKCHESLRIDNYYLQEEENKALVADWGTALHEALT